MSLNQLLSVLPVCGKYVVYVFLVYETIYKKEVGEKKPCKSAKCDAAQTLNFLLTEINVCSKKIFLPEFMFRYKFWQYSA